MDKNYIVYISKLADFLIEKGETFLHVRPNLKDPKFQVFVFKFSSTIIQNVEA